MKEGKQERTLDLLRDIGATYVVVDEPQGFKTSVPPVVAATSPDLAMIRFHGHNAENWEKRGITAAERFRYLYSEDELREWVGPARELAGEAKQLHVLMNNCYADYGVRNAAQFADLLAGLSALASPPAPGRRERAHERLQVLRRPRRHHPVARIQVERRLDAAVLEEVHERARLARDQLPGGGVDGAADVRWSPCRRSAPAAT